MRKPSSIDKPLSQENKQDEKIKRRAGILEQELADEYWQDQYEKYLLDGGDLDFDGFMEIQLDNKISTNISDFKKLRRSFQSGGNGKIKKIPTREFMKMGVRERIQTLYGVKINPSDSVIDIMEMIADLPIIVEID